MIALFSEFEMTLIFCVPCLFTTWPIIALHNFLSFAILRNVSLFTIPTAYHHTSKKISIRTWLEASQKPVFPVSVTHYVFQIFQLSLSYTVHKCGFISFLLNTSLLLTGSDHDIRICITTLMFSHVFSKFVRKLSGIRCHISALILHSSSAQFSFCK